MSEQSFSSPAPMDNWSKEVLDEMLEITNRKVLEWCSILVRLGFPENLQLQWRTVFKNEVEGLYDDMIQNANDHQHNIFSEIERLLQSSEELCKQLHIKMPDYGVDRLSLYEEQRLLKEKVQEYQLQVDEIRKEVSELNKKHLKLCKNLGLSPKPMSETTIPSQVERETFRNTLASYSDEYYLRSERFCTMKCKIMELIGELEYQPCLDFERTVMDPDESKFLLSDSNMCELQKFYDSLNTQLRDMKEEETALKEKIKDLWELLAEDIKYRNDFLLNLTGTTGSILQNLRAEHKRCEDVKKANIADFVKRLRDELLNWWQKCHFTKDQQRDFHYFYSDMYTEDLLTLHDMEIDKVKKYYSDNRELFTLIEKRKELWEKMLQLEERGNAPDRYKNRGGQLLKEEKERNALSKRIPQMEERLLQLGKEYQSKNGEPFLSWGETLETIIHREHELHENARKLKLCSKKQQRDRTPGKSMQTLTPCSSTKNLTNMPENKRKLCTPLFPSKRPRVLKEHNDNVPRTAPPKITLNGRSLKASRVSTERGKKIKRCMRWSKGKDQKENENTLDTTSSSTCYEAFQSGLQNKDSQRSTIFLEAGPSTPMALAIPTTPRHRNNTPKTPKTAPSHSRTLTPRTTTKLTKAPSLKLLF